MKTVFLVWLTIVALDAAIESAFEGDIMRLIGRAVLVLAPLVTLIAILREEEAVC